MTTILSGWRKLRHPPQHDFDVESAEAAREAAEMALLEEQVKAQRTKEVKERLRDLHTNNHFAQLIADTVEDNSRR